MTALRIASRILSLVSACALLMCGLLVAAVVPWAHGLWWVAVVCIFVGMWEGR